MSQVNCPIWESCRNQCSAVCFNCIDNDYGEEPLKDCYEFNHWDDDENYEDWNEE